LLARSLLPHHRVHKANAAGLRGTSLLKICNLKQCTSVSVSVLDSSTALPSSDLPFLSSYQHRHPLQTHHLPCSFFRNPSPASSNTYYLTTTTITYSFHLSYHNTLFHIVYYQNNTPSRRPTSQNPLLILHAFPCLRYNTTRYRVTFVPETKCCSLFRSPETRNLVCARRMITVLRHYTRDHTTSITHPSPRSIDRTARCRPATNLPCLPHIAGCHHRRR